MIKLEELSLGNWVKFAGKFCKISQWDKEKDEVCLSTEDDFPVITNDIILDIDLTPIPLNDKILEVNEFKPVDNNCFIYPNPKGNIIILVKIKEGMYEVGHGTGLYIKYVHQLQNLLGLYGTFTDLIRTKDA